MSSFLDKNRPFEQATIVMFFLRWVALPLYQQFSVYTLLQVKRNSNNCFSIKISSESQIIIHQYTSITIFVMWVCIPQVAPLFMVGGYYLSFFFVISHNFEGVYLFGPSAEKKYDSFLHKQVRRTVCPRMIAIRENFLIVDCFFFVGGYSLQCRWQLAVLSERRTELSDRLG